MIARVDYVILYVGDLERSIAFYREMVGLQLKLQDRGYAEFVTEGTKFGLFERAKLPELIGRVARAGGPGGEVAFLVEDVDAESARLRAAGAQILAGPTDRPWGHRTLHLLDPDGFVVEFAQEIERAPVSP
jgi:lactoylglutathione lyase